MRKKSVFSESLYDIAPLERPDKSPSYCTGYHHDLNAVKRRIMNGEKPSYVSSNIISFGYKTYNGIGMKIYNELLRGRR